MDRGERRYRAKKKQSQRLKKLKDHGRDVEEENHRGQLKNNHFGCGCWMCKPWKHGKDSELKPSELRSKPDDDED